MQGLNNLDLNLLKVFDAIHRARSVSLAAEHLNMSQPAVSNALNRLRQTLGDQIFVRTRNGMEPTELAQLIAGPVQLGLQRIQTSIAHGSAFDPAESLRSFTILATDLGEETYIGPLMKVLEKEAPNITVNVFEAPLEEYENLLEFGHADFAIGRLDISERFIREHIASCRYSVLLCARHAEMLGIRDGDTIPYDLYIAQRHVNVLTRATPAHRHPVDAALTQRDARRRIALTLPHASVLSEILPGTTLVATAPDAAIPPNREKAGLVHARLPFETETLKILLFWHKRQQLDKGHCWMREQILARPAAFWNVRDAQDAG
ncbi:LysR family transcriptional regulator [Salipiger abyssi]|uniref:Transcriptional regulator n=1 Tax=Salipiger abyssi TaxID=1250539 RepID=A0A1P8UNA2_9RHOB|nr:LysR family transcriptional regulator [Salipiger abyssi]APZ50855.1 transcriptional regulator [Salipiger abyssi]